VMRSIAARGRGGKEKRRGSFTSKERKCLLIVKGGERKKRKKKNRRKETASLTPHPREEKGRNFISATTLGEGKERGKAFSNY